MADKDSNIHQLIGKSMYAQVHKPSKFNKFQVDLILDEDDQYKKAEDLGLKIREGEDKYEGKPFVSITRDDKMKDGSAVSIEVVDSDNKPMTALIGNNSKVVAEFGAYPYDNRYGVGVAARLYKLKVLDLVPYDEQ